jgi:hypothetical protein
MIWLTAKNGCREFILRLFQGQAQEFDPALAA